MASPSRPSPRPTPTTSSRSSMTARSATCPARLRLPGPSAPPWSRPRPPGPHLLPVYISLTAGDVSEQVKATLDAAGGDADAPGRRGGVRGDRRASRGGSAAGGSRLTRAPAGRLARARGRPRAVGRGRRRLDPLDARGRGPAPAPCPVRAREPRAARRGRPAGDAVAGRPAGPGRGGRRMARARRRRVALKLDAEGLAHKTEAGGVALGLADEAALRAAVTRLATAASRGGRRAAPRVPRGADGAGRRGADRRRAPRSRSSGRSCWWGWAGSWRRCSTTSRCSSRLPEAGGGPRPARRVCGVRPSCAGSAADLVSTSTPSPRSSSDVSRHSLSTDPSIAEIDLNPVIAGPGGAVAVDALLVHRSARRPEPGAPGHRCVPAHGSPAAHER